MAELNLVTAQGKFFKYLESVERIVNKKTLRQLGAKRILFLAVKILNIDKSLNLNVREGTLWLPEYTGKTLFVTACKIQFINQIKLF